MWRHQRYSHWLFWSLFTLLGLLTMKPPVHRPVKPSWNTVHICSRSTNCYGAGLSQATVASSIFKRQRQQWFPESLQEEWVEIPWGWASKSKLEFQWRTPGPLAILPPVVFLSCSPSPDIMGARLRVGLIFSMQETVISSFPLQHELLVLLPIRKIVKGG